MASQNQRVEQQLTLAQSPHVGTPGQGSVAAAVSGGNFAAVPRITAEDVLAKLIAQGGTSVIAELLEWTTLYSGGTPATGTTPTAEISLDVARRLAPILTGDDRNLAATLVSTFSAFTYAITGLRLVAPIGNVVGPASAIDNGVVFFDGTTGKLIKSITQGAQGNAAGDLIVDPNATGTPAFKIGSTVSMSYTAATLVVSVSSGAMLLSTPGIVQLSSSTSRSIKLTNVNLEMLTVAGVASAVNEVTITNAVTTVGPTIESTGDDTNIDLLLVAKGSGVVKADGVEVVTLTGSQTLTNKTLVTPTIASFVNATHSHLNAAGGGTLTAAAISDFSTSVIALLVDANIPDTITISNITQITTRLHSSLQSLTSGDDHTQYVLLAGRSGGQVIYGGTAASNGITISSTSHATKGTTTLGDVGDTTVGDGTLRTFRPQTDQKIDLGSSSFRFNDIFMGGSLSIKTGDVTFTSDGVGTITFTVGGDIVTDTSTGTKIGTGTTQKLGFFNATPVAQISGSTDILASLVTLGFRAASSNPPLDMGTGTLTCGAISAGGNLTFADAKNIVINTTTGTKIGTGTTQKIGFWNVTPVVQPSAYTQTYSTASKTHTQTTMTDPAAYAAGANGYSTGAMASAIHAEVIALRANMIVVQNVLNQVIDDLQAVGILS